MQPQNGTEINVGQHIAVEHDDRIGQRDGGISDRAAGAKRHRLDDIPQTDAQVRALAEDLLDPPRLVVEAENDLVDFRNLLEEIDLVIQKRSVENRNDRLRRVNRQWPEPRPLPAGEKNGLHPTYDDNADCGLLNVDF